MWVANLVKFEPWPSESAFFMRVLLQIEIGINRSLACFYVWTNTPHLAVRLQTFEFASYFFAYAKFEKGCVIELAILLRFSKTRELWSSKANWHLCFSLPSMILVDLSGNRTLLQRVQRSWFVICDCWISIRFVCFCVSRFVACDRIYDRRQRKTQLWRRLLSFRVRVFVKSAVTKWSRQPWHSPVYVWLLWFWPVLYLVWLFLLFLFPGFG